MTTAKKKTTKKKTTKKAGAKKTAKRSSKKAAADTPPMPPMPPAMPGQQEHIPETLCEVNEDVQKAAIEYDTAKKATAAWGRLTQTRKATLDHELEKNNITGTYYDGRVRVAQNVTEKTTKTVEVEVIDAHTPEAAE